MRKARYLMIGLSTDLNNLQGHALKRETVRKEKARTNVNQDL